MRRSGITLGVLVVAMAAVSGCTKYYEISDPASGKVYYTTRINEKLGGGIEFTDEETGETVTVQNSEIEEISKSRYEAEVGG